jgi:hypothetical protein
MNTAQCLSNSFVVQRCAGNNFPTRSADNECETLGLTYGATNSAGEARCRGDRGQRHFAINWSPL